MSQQLYFLHVFFFVFVLPSRHVGAVYEKKVLSAFISRKVLVCLRFKGVPFPLTLRRIVTPLLVVNMQNQGLRGIIVIQPYVHLTLGKPQCTKTGGSHSAQVTIVDQAFKNC